MGFCKFCRKYYLLSVYQLIGNGELLAARNFGKWKHLLIFSNSTEFIENCKIFDKLECNKRFDLLHLNSFTN